MNDSIQLPRADQVGSLLRPQALLDARAAHARRDIDAAALRLVEDRCIATAVQRQLDTGIGCITDGEFRRSYFHLDFFSQPEGVTLQGAIAASSDAGEKVGFTPPRLAVTGKLQHRHAIMQRDCEYLQSLTNTLTKITIPSPSMLHFRGGRAAIDATAYPDLDVFFDDLARCYRQEIQALYAAGCRYLQLDDTNLAYLCDPRMRADAAARGDDPDALPILYARLINQALAGRPVDMKVGIHLCRGNYRSTWFASGGYEPVADVLFNSLDVDAYLLEFDDARSGDFSPLRFVPEGKRVVLGLISSKVGELEAREQVLRGLDDAMAFLPLEQLSLSPQCGFASTSHGNALGEEQQWAKLRLVAELASDIWADARAPLIQQPAAFECRCDLE